MSKYATGFVLVLLFGICAFTKANECTDLADVQYTLSSAMSAATNAIAVASSANATCAYAEALTTYTQADVYPAVEANVTALNTSISSDLQLVTDLLTGNVTLAYSSMTSISTVNETAQQLLADSDGLDLDITRVACTESACKAAAAADLAAMRSSYRSFRLAPIEVKTCVSPDHDMCVACSGGGVKVECIDDSSSSVSLTECDGFPEPLVEEVDMPLLSSNSTMKVYGYATEGTCCVDNGGVHTCSCSGGYTGTYCTVPP
uniref:EGF-like domain-containing protein n=1 Tax=Palpitomonas bilix TaxID=652834 RepID=A0A7S3GG45_9EUKA|mmetsp:Transcript_47880/g.124284  ORF Transcript_47880/g.124284 Transcript_47880/m.124284 type:complete len:261 (+) Transcript_47880:394-1176(+)